MSSNKSISFHRLPIICFFAVACCTTLVTIQYTYAFSPSSNQVPPVQNRINLAITPTTIKHNTRTYATSSPLDNDDEIQNQLAKARKLVEEAKAKVAAANKSAEEEEVEVEKELKTKGQGDEKRKSVIKSRNEETGLVTTDGELMAELSAEEDWEVKALMDVFESESTKGRHDPISNSLAERDVAASIFNMRMQMKDEDYRKIFDKRNRFIGEDN